MADKDLGDGPSLEMPSLGSLFKRKKKGAAPAPDEATPTAEDFDALVRGDKEAETPREPAAAEPAAERTDDEPVAEETAVEEPEAQAPVEEPEAHAPVEEPVAEEPPAEPEPDSEPTVIVPPVEDPVEVDETPAPIVVDEPVEATSDVEDTAVLPSGEMSQDDPDTILDTEPDPTPAAAAPEAPAASEPDEGADEEADEDEDEDAEPRPKREFTLPPLAARTAAALTGVLIGILAVGLTYGSLRGCEAIKGTSSCGSPGFFLLVAIMIILVALGSSLLGAWKVVDPTSTSFLAVGLLAVIALLFLVRVIFSPWMIVVIPLVAAATYTASHWLTSLFEDDDVVTE